MSDDDKRFLNADDKYLWEYFTKHFQQVAGQQTKAPLTNSAIKTKARSNTINIRARLDLHGFTQDRAFAALITFINVSHRQGYKCVLVITGKGREITSDEWWAQSPGVLKREVPKWLNSPTLQGKIRSFTQAELKDGGSGALYVYLK